ncbi:hypothetical protein ACQUKI_20415 [Ralstonia pseudosolanacearum]
MASAISAPSVATPASVRRLANGAANHSRTACPGCGAGEPSRSSSRNSACNCGEAERLPVASVRASASRPWRNAT